MLVEALYLKLVRTRSSFFSCLMLFSPFLDPKHPDLPISSNFNLPDTSIRMNHQAAAQVSAPMQQIVVIPAFAPAFGPQLGRLAQELLLQIFKEVARNMWPEASRFRKCIDAKAFRVINHSIAVDRIRSVSSDFASFFMEALYENHHFSSKATDVINKQSIYCTSIPAPLPHRNVRHHLRSLQLTVAVENHYFTRQLIPDLFVTNMNGHKLFKITTAKQLMLFCPSAMVLHQLTDPEVGFGSLRFLDLQICISFERFPLDEDFLRAVAEAKFVFVAGEVKLVVTEGGFATAAAEKVKAVLE